MTSKYEVAQIRGGGGTVEFDASKRMEGGMKHVYFTRDRTGVVAFFHDRADERARESRLSRVVNQYNPTRDSQTNAAYWRDLFCWPKSLIDHSQYGLGLHLPAYPPCFFFQQGPLKGLEKDGGWFSRLDRSTGRLLRYSRVHPSERGNLQTYLACFIRVARAVERMHNAGLAHADLSERNVLIDPSSGRAIIIDVDSLVVTGLYPPDVLGTPGYIAPEVMATKHLNLKDPNRKHPCADTDKHALPVMIYKYLLERHPLEGDRVLKGVAAEQEDDALYGSKALYSEHRNDPQNRPRDPKYYSAQILGKRIDDLFHKAFVDGLQQTKLRPTPGSWVTALCEAFDILLACPNPSCTHKMYVLIDPEAPVCPFCGTSFRGTFSVMRLTHEEKSFRRLEGEVVLNGFQGGSGTILYRFHTHRGALRGPGQDSTPVAEVVFLTTPAPTFYLKNLNLPGMQARVLGSAQSTFQSVPINAKLQLSTGLEIRFGNEPDSRIGAVTTYYRP